MEEHIDQVVAPWGQSREEVVQGIAGQSQGAVEIGLHSAPRPHGCLEDGWKVRQRPDQRVQDDLQLVVVHPPEPYRLGKDGHRREADGHLPITSSSRRTREAMRPAVSLCVQPGPPETECPDPRPDAVQNLARIERLAVKPNPYLPSL